MDQRKTQAICSAGTSGKRSLSTRYLLGLKNRLSNTDLKMSMKLTRKVKGHFRKRKKDQCCQSVNPGEETGLMEARFSGGPVPGDRKIQHRTLGLRAETVERPRNHSQAARQTAPSLVSVFRKPGGAWARHSGGCLESYWLTAVRGRGEHAPPTGRELRPGRQAADVPFRHRGRRGRRKRRELRGSRVLSCARPGLTSLQRGPEDTG